MLQDVLPVMQSHWQKRTRPVPAEIAWALAQYERVWAVDGSTLDALMRRVGLQRDLPDHPLAGHMMGVLDVSSRLPVHLWYNEDDQRWTGKRFWDPILEVLLPGTLLLPDLGFTNYGYYARLIAAQVTFITRCKSSAAYQVTQVLHKSAHLHDTLILLGHDQLPMRPWNNLNL